MAAEAEGGERAAMAYTLIETAKLNGVEPEAYLRDIIARIGIGVSIKEMNESSP
jgi:hypothetical protein